MILKDRLWPKIVRKFRRLPARTPDSVFWFQHLQDIIITIGSEESYLKQLEGWLEQKESSVTRNLIDSVAIKIARLYEDRQKLMALVEGRVGLAA